MMLNAYISALKAYLDRSASAGNREGVGQPSLDRWDQALKFANNALATFRKAEIQRKNGDVDSADMSALEGLRLLHERYYLPSTHSVRYPLFCISTGTVSTAYKSKLLMTGWDEDEIMKA
jgi:hypothetical protein